MSSNRHTTLDSSIAAAIGRARQGAFDEGAVIDNRIQSPLLTTHMAPVPVRGAAGSVQTYTLDQLLPPQSSHGRMVTIDQDMSTAARGWIGGQSAALGGQSAAFGGPGDEIQMVETAPGMWDTGFDQSTGSDIPADGTGGNSGSGTPASDPSGAVGAIVESEMPTAPCPPPRRWVKEYYYRPGGVLSWRWVCKDVEGSATAIGVPGGGAGIGVPPAALAECKCEIEIPKPIEIDLSKKPKGVYPVPLTAKDLSFRVRVWLRGNDPSKRNVTLEALPAVWISSISPNPSTDKMCYPVDTAEFDVTISEEWVRSQLPELRESESGEKKYQIRFKADAGNAKCEKLVDVVLKTCSIVELEKKAQAHTKSPLVLTLDGPHVHNHNLPILEELRNHLRLTNTNPSWDDLVQVGTARMKAVLKYFIGVIESAPDCCCEYLLDVRLTIDISITVDDRAGSKSSQAALAKFRSEIPHLRARADEILDGLKTLYPVCNSFNAAVACREKKWYVDDRVGAALDEPLTERIHALPEWFGKEVGAVDETPSFSNTPLGEVELYEFAMKMRSLLIARMGMPEPGRSKGQPPETPLDVRIIDALSSAENIAILSACVNPGVVELVLFALREMLDVLGKASIRRLLLVSLQALKPTIVTAEKYLLIISAYNDFKKMSPKNVRVLVYAVGKLDGFLAKPDFPRGYVCVAAFLGLFADIRRPD